MSEIVIRVEGLGKQYWIGQREASYHTLRETIRDAVFGTVRRAQAVFRGEAAPARSEELWALKEVSFEVRRGEVVGVIGRNGAGKSTLLKILSRITEPTEGEACLRGRVGALLEVGTGFHPELTGRDNIYLNGALLGMRRADIRRQFDAIVEFAEIEKFIATPVKHYSSGMYMRLAFSIAAHLNPEILIVDEVLAVGDMKFQKRCLEKMDDISRSGRSILFVSHNMQAVRNLCQRCLLLADGRLCLDGPPGPVVAEYHRRTTDVKLSASTVVHDSRLRRGSAAVRFTKVEIQDAAGNNRVEFDMGERIRFVMRYQVHRAVPNLYLALIFKSALHLEMLSSIRVTISTGPVPSETAGEAVVELPALQLRPGEYPMMFWLGDQDTLPYDILDNLLAPLMIRTDKTHDELGYDPAGGSGYFDLEYRVELSKFSYPSPSPSPCPGGRGER